MMIYLHERLKSLKYIQEGRKVNQAWDEAMDKLVDWSYPSLKFDGKRFPFGDDMRKDELQRLREKIFEKEKNGFK